LWPRGHHPVLQLDQLTLQAEQLAEVVAPRVAAFQREVGRGVARQRGDRAVFELQLQFLVVAIDQVAVNAIHQGIVGRQGDLGGIQGLAHGG
jgi:hypothetical protein